MKRQKGPWEVWRVPLEDPDCAVRLAGPFDNLTTAQDTRWHLEQAESAPDKRKYYRWEVRTVATTDDFWEDEEPVGIRVDINDESTARNRLARRFFHQQLFVYFGELSSGQTGWGISFNDWLRLKGWNHFERGIYERSYSIEE